MYLAIANGVPNNAVNIQITEHKFNKIGSVKKL